MDYRKNEDMLQCEETHHGVSYNQILSVTAAEVETEPVTLQEAKDFAKIDVDDDDDLITELITTARDMCEQYTNISFVAREITATFNNCNGGTFLPYGPIADDVELTDIDVVELTDPTLTGGPWKQVLLPKDKYISATYTGGYETLPKKFKTAILNTIYYLYDNRAVGVDNIGPIAQTILNPLRRV